MANIALVYFDKDFPPIRRMIGDPALDDPRFLTRAGRIEHAADLLPLLRPWFATRTRAEIHAETSRLGLPIAPVWRITDLGDDAQFLAQNFLAQNFLATIGGQTMPTIPVTWNGARFTPRPAPELAHG